MARLAGKVQRRPAVGVLPVDVEPEPTHALAAPALPPQPQLARRVGEAEEEGDDTLVARVHSHVQRQHAVEGRGLHQLRVVLTTHAAQSQHSKLRVAEELPPVNLWMNESANQSMTLY